MRLSTRITYIVITLVAMVFSAGLHAEEIIYDSPEDIAPNQSESQPILNNLDNLAIQNSDKPVPESSVQNVPPLPQLVEDQPITTEVQPQEKFIQLEKEVAAGTKNLSTYFEYAQTATFLGKISEAVNAYKYMLGTDASLSRVKLELAMLYLRTGKFKQAKQLFEEVLATNPPEEVKKNIEQVMVVVNQALKPNVFSGSVSTGYNIDTNANSAASSGQATFVDTSIPLSSGSTASRDGHAYAAVSLTNVHKFDIDSEYYKLSFETTGTLYQTKQDTESSLDLGLASIKTGPVIEFPELKTKLGINGTESMINLNGENYLKTRSWGTDVSYIILDNLLLNGSYSYEYRKFINSATATTYTDRSGNANQQSMGVTYALTPYDIFNTSIMWRYENAESQIYGDTQQSITGSYTRILPWDLTFNTLFGFKETSYHEPDPLISSSILRHDRERSMTYTLAKKLPHNLSATTAYQYKNVTSNIQNYDYSNNRYSVGLGWSF